jgi:hypothetical protein
MRLFDDALDAKLRTVARIIQVGKERALKDSTGLAELDPQGLAAFVAAAPIAVVSSEILEIACTYPAVEEDYPYELERQSPIIAHFVYFERPLETSHEPIRAFAAVALDGGARHDRLGLLPFRCDYEYPTPLDQVDGSWRHAASGVLALAGDFLERERPERAQRRRAARALPTMAPIDEVVTLRLRRVESSQDAGSSSDVHWSHRWLVRGHWRRLPGGVVWVRQHVKGPTDRPLIVKEKRTLLDR